MDLTRPVIDLDGICYAYPGSSSPVLDHLCITVNEGERIALTGPNGSGKTTLFHVIMGLLRPSAGTVRIDGTPRVRDRDFVSVRRRIGLLFQDSDDQLFSPTVLDDVAFGPLNMGLSRREARDKALSVLDVLGLDGFGPRITHRLSGGEKRLVALASVLAMDPGTLLLDEPTTGLDDRTRERLIHILEGLDKTLVVISHDPDFVDRVTRIRYRMDGGTLRGSPGFFN
ncbi:ABC transporter ATP-binding protein [Desulfatiferula olefinivorans]